MEKQIRDLVGEYRSGRIERAEFLKWAALLGISVPLLHTPVVRAASSQAPSRGGTIKVAGGTTLSIDPPMLIDPVGIGIAQQFGEYLVQVSPKLIPQAQLATSWSASQGGQVWTIKVRQGVKFHSGKALTADDVVATFQRLVDPKGSSTAKSSLSFLTPQGVKKVDDFTVEFSLERPVVDFPYYLSTYQAIILPTTYNGNIAKQKDGTGPYKLVEYVPGQRARFVRNPDYWNKPLPYLDGVEVVLGFSTGGQITALLGGAADTSIVTDYTHIQILQGNPQFRISTAQSSSHNGIFLRTDKAPFTDVRVRQALALAIDRPIVIQNLSNGFGVLGNDNIIAPVFPVYTPTPQRAKDIAKAKALLTAAGHPKGFSTSILTASDSALGTLAPLGIVAQQMFATIGVDAPLRTEPSSIYYNTDWLTAPVTITDWAHRPTPSQFISVAYRSGAVWNASHWSNSQFDKLATQLDATLDLSKRKTIAHQIELLQTAQTPSLLTFFEKIGRPVSVKLEGVFADPANNLDLSRAYFVK